jgi:hypothetical protein
MPITNDQAQTWDILVNILIKLLVAITVIVGFFIILYYVINPKSSGDGWRLTVLEAILGSTMFVVVAHYFPAVKAAVKSK